MAADIGISREGDARGGRYVSVVDGHRSEMTFVWARRAGVKLMIVGHTGVPKALSGRGVGLALVARAVEDARAEGFRIVPHCSFVRVMLQRHKDWQDVAADASANV
ncbi:MAG: N-acetyltransferase [Alphaproteobacteria bacterium]|nr:N-acetyltransferase [Alphaproteobacteria bacterium]